MARRGSRMLGMRWAMALVSLLGAATGVLGQAQYRVARAYEDTVRIAIIWNNASGNSCGNGSLHQPVGEKTRDFVLMALDTARVPHTRVMVNTNSSIKATWADIEAMWGGDTLPHVIVHVNAGWSSGWNGSELRDIFSQAVSRHIGVVSIGDDAASLADQTFGFAGVSNVPAPLGDGTSFDSLWIGLNRANDDRIKALDNAGALLYPYVNGIVSNAIDSIMHAGVLQFKPINNGRCQADADKYTIRYPNWNTYLGYQQGYKDAVDQPGPDELHVLVAIQDTMANLTIRRGVAVSFQPQFLANPAASQQIVYDAIMFASLTHTLFVASRLTIVVESDTLMAGDTLDNMRAYLYDQNGDVVQDLNILSAIQWYMDPTSRRPGDAVLTPNGPASAFTATLAHREARVIASYIEGASNTVDTARIWIKPGPPDHLIVEGTPTGMSSPNADNPVGGNGSVRLLSSDNRKSVWAIIRDRFGNYIENSKATAWDTLPPGGIVSAAPGNQVQGEGVVTKVGPDGSTRVRAASTVYLGAKFADTINVTVDKVTYTELRILDEGRQAIDTLTMKTTDKATLHVEGKREDGLGWEPVPANWSLSSGLTVVPPPPSNSQTWANFSPSDSGTGTIGASLGALTTSIVAVFQPGWPEYLKLYPAAGNPASQTVLAPFTAGVADTIKAGEQTTLYAKVFDWNNVWLSDYETDPVKASQIKWRLSTGEEVDTTIGPARLTLSSTMAYRTVTVTASLEFRGRTIEYGSSFYVAPGDPHHLVIEASPDIQSTGNFNDDAPLDSITMRGDQDLVEFYAILRDQWGNFVTWSNPTGWSSLNESVALADTGEATDVGEGVAIRVDNGRARIVATDGVTGKNLKDSILVLVQNYWYLELKIVNASGDTLDSLVMNTNQDTTLFVIGLRSNDSTWEAVQADWRLSAGLKVEPGPPTQAERYSFSPTDTASQGWIRVSQGSQVEPYTLPVVFTPGPPTSIDMAILTPPESRVAGKPVKARLTIENEDGRVPGAWCGKVSFSDLLDTVLVDIDGDTLRPAVVVGTDTLALGEDGPICFGGGIATVDFLLYYAPASQDAHKLGVVFTDTVTAIPLTDTARVIMAPGPVARVDIVEEDSPPRHFPGDSIWLDFSDGQLIKVVGYDRFGNLIADRVPGNWSVSGGIPSVSRPDNTPQIYYEVQNVLYESRGYIHVAYAIDGAIRDSVVVHISPKPATLVSAFTRDTSGNGFLDAIDVTFNKSLAIPETFDLLSNATLSYRGSYFTVVGITSMSGNTADSLWRIVLRESTSGGEPQTAWAPSLTLRNVPGASDVSKFLVTDGAPPVIWSVERWVNSAGDRTKDKVVVELSEPIVESDGGPFSVGNAPELVFHVWVMTSDGSYEPRDSIVAGINQFGAYTGRRLEFLMSNGQELTGEHYLTLVSDSPVLADETQRNAPAANNQHVRVRVQAAMGSLVIGPNPFPASFFVPPTEGGGSGRQSELKSHVPENVYQWVNQRGGAALVLNSFILSSDRSIPAKVQLMVFDAVGNLVHTRQAEDAIPHERWDDAWVDGDSRQLVFYWNGITDRGVRAAPGVYRMVMSVEYAGDQSLYRQNVGIGR